MSILRYIPISALGRGQKIIRRAMQKNFTWEDETAILKKLQEEIKEFTVALSTGDKKNQEEELGDIFFTLVCLATHMRLSAADILSQANKKFQKRFAMMEAMIKQDNKKITNLSPIELERYWQRVKKLNKKNVG